MHDVNAVVPRARPPGELADQFQRRWLAEDTPSIDDFLASAPTASAAEICGVLRVDLRERWRHGSRVSPEGYLSRFPQVADDSETAGDLIFTEFLLREDLGEAPTQLEYVTKYPRYAELLAAQIQFHHAVNEVDLLQLSDDSSQAGQQLSWGQASPRDSSQPTDVPEMIGRYRIMRQLGSGGMGSVWLARDAALDRDVALKLPRLSKASGGKMVERFYREARAAAKLSHPNLCVIHDVGDESGIPYLAMQYLAGETLETVLRREAPLSPARAVDLAIQMAKGLEAVHRGGVVHRDLKPANVIFNEHKVPIVTDFGLAFLQSGTRDDLTDAADDSGDATSASCEYETAAAHRLTVGGQLLGTPAYAAPEQLLGDIDGFSIACDVYSLGIVLFEMLTGCVPFEGSVSELMRRVLTFAAPPPSSLNAELPPALDAICHQALEKEPSARFDSKSAFRIALEQAAETLDRNKAANIASSPADQLPPLPTIQPPSKSKAVPNRRRFLAAGCLTALSGGTAYFALRTKPSPSIDQERLISSTNLATSSSTFTSATQLELDDYAPRLSIVRQHDWATRHAFLTGFSPNGAYYWCGGEYYLGEQVRVWETTTGREAISVRGSYLRFSPDCRTIYSAVRNATPRIERWNLDSGTRLAALDSEDLAIDLAVAPDGKTLISTHQENLTTWDLETRKAVWKSPLHGIISPYVSAVNNDRAFVYDARKSGCSALVDLNRQRIIRRFDDTTASPSRLLRWIPETSQLVQINERELSTWALDPPAPIRSLQFTADGNKITAKAISRDARWALVATELSPRVYLINLTTGRTHGVASIGKTEFLIGYHDISPDGRYAVFCCPAPSEVFVLGMPPEVWQGTL